MCRFAMASLLSAVVSTAVSPACAQEAKELQCTFWGYLHYYVKLDYANSLLVVGPFFPGQAPHTDVLRATYDPDKMWAYKNQNGYTVASFSFDRYAGTLMIVDMDPHAERTSAPCEPYRVQQRKY